MYSIRYSRVEQMGKQNEFVISMLKLILRERGGYFLVQSGIQVVNNRFGLEKKLKASLNIRKRTQVYQKKQNKMFIIQYQVCSLQTSRAIT